MKLGIYCRISRNKEGNDLSIPDQKQKGINKAKELSLPYELYIDEGKTGASDNIEDRPQFEKMIADIIGGKISAVYAYDQSRIERNPQIRFFINDIFKKNDIKYYTEFDGLVDLENPQTEFYGDLMSVINKYHVTMTKVKVKSALRNRVLSGKAHSILPYGYAKNDKGELIINEGESLIVKQIYKLSLSGMGTRSIADFLNEKGIPTRYNKIGKGTVKTKNKYTGTITETKKNDIKWAGNTVRGIIKNTIYKGERNYSNEVFKVPAIVTSSYWEKVNSNLNNNRNNTGKKVEHKYLLKGLLRCGVCGRNMYGRTRVSKNDNYYMCSSKRIKNKNCGNRSINIDKIEALIWDRFFRSDEFINRIRKELKPDESKSQISKSQISLTQKKIEQLKKEKKKAIELVIKGTLSEDDVKDIISKTNTKIEELELELDEKKSVSNLLDNSIQIFKKYKDTFEEISKKTTFLQKKRIVNDFIKNIEITYDNFQSCYEIDIEFKVDLKNENYIAFNNFTNVLYKGDFIVPRTIKKMNFVKPVVIEIDGRNVEMLGGDDDDSVPYKVGYDGFLEKVFNTKVPYGNVDDWTEDEIEDFYCDNPDWYCKESGVSLWSKNENLASFETAKMEYQKMLAKKNEFTPPLDTISSDIVWCGLRNGRCVIKEVSFLMFPDTE